MDTHACCLSALCRRGAAWAGGMRERQLSTPADLLLRCPSAIWCFTQDVESDICEVDSGPRLHPADELGVGRELLWERDIYTLSHPWKSVWRQNMRTWWCPSGIIVSSPSKHSTCHLSQRTTYSSARKAATGQQTSFTNSSGSGIVLILQTHAHRYLIHLKPTQVFQCS